MNFKLYLAIGRQRQLHIKVAQEYNKLLDYVYIDIFDDIWLQLYDGD